MGGGTRAPSITKHTSITHGFLEKSLSQPNPEAAPTHTRQIPSLPPSSPFQVHTQPQNLIPSGIKRCLTAEHSHSHSLLGPALSEQKHQDFCILFFSWGEALCYLLCLHSSSTWDVCLAFFYSNTFVPLVFLTYFTVTLWALTEWWVLPLFQVNTKKVKVPQALQWLLLQSFTGKRALPLFLSF